MVLVHYRPCSNAKKIVLGPLPEVVGGVGLISFLSMWRNDFLCILLGKEHLSLHLVASRMHSGELRVVNRLLAE
jgi:hypothetical protein